MNPKFSQIFAKHENATELAEQAQIAWAEVTTALEEGGLTTKLRLEMALRYVLTRVEYHRLYQDAMHEGPAHTAENGNQFAAIKWHAVHKLNEQLLRLEEALMISPKATGAKPAIPARPKQTIAADEFLN